MRQTYINIRILDAEGKDGRKTHERKQSVGNRAGRSVEENEGKLRGVDAVADGRRVKGQPGGRGPAEVGDDGSDENGESGTKRSRG